MQCLRALAAVCLFAPAVVQAQGHTYYVDSRTGSDSASGSSARAPWRSLHAMESRRFAPGDSILFARGAQFTGGFIFRASGTAERPIVFGAYGAGDAPSFTNPAYTELNGNIFRIEGSHIVVSSLYFHDNTNPPAGENARHEVQKLGAVFLGNRADSNVVRDCEFVRSPVGIKIKGSWNLITHNHLHDAPVAMGRNWGPIAIMIVSPHNEISYNRIERYGYYGGAYGSDGGAIEVDGVDDAFDPRDINVHHNISIGNHGFMEVAGRNADSITVAYNVSDDVDKFLGGGSMDHVAVTHNTVIRTREPNIDRWIFWTFDRPHTTAEITNNIFVVAADLQVFPQTPIPEGHKRTGLGAPRHSGNVFFSPGGGGDPSGLPLGADERIVDPQFVDAEHEDYHLRSGSRARGAGYAPK